MGFGSEVKTSREKDLVELYAHLHPDDLIRYGLIPEFVGRLPITVTLQDLDEDALTRIVTEPRNAIVKQYKAFLKIDGVDLEFEDDAIAAIARKAMERKTGARGLRAIVEDIMLEIMFDIPSIKGRKRIVVTRDVVEKGEQPEIVPLGNKKSA